MRRHLKKKYAALLLLLFVGGIYLLHQVDVNASGQTALPEISWQGRHAVSRESWVEQGDYLPLNVSYQLLAGKPSTQQRFLCIGISSVKRSKGSYLVTTLQSLFSQSSPEERQSMLVVLLLADFDSHWIFETVNQIKSTFPSELDQGQLLLIHVPKECYPSTAGLKRNYNDPPDRVSFRSKQNLDYSFLMHYSSGVSKYYLQLEDDVISAKNFLTAIKTRVQQQEAKKTTWAMLEFSSLGFIGKLYKSAHLPLLARFLFLFYQEMPCDWLMSHFRLLLTQKEPIFVRPSLFQHIGQFSSFKGVVNKLKDKDFEEVYTNPPAEVFSNMSTYEKNYPKLAWEPGEGFFWGRSPGKGDYLTVVFKEPTLVTGIYIETGSGGKDLLQSALVELGTEVLSAKTHKTCGVFKPQGSFERGVFLMEKVKDSGAASCLRILVTQAQSDWLIITRIRVTTSSGPKLS
ncbi:alpha-1,3-mannosyl-glycoprotein 4-beta-N-acetylglucosaminyltransferase C-like isoform X2 [Synchiropus splendidus]|nr:alpha-1,3-mannosyl-glycoprotein 4-beta-N-acetylglucosaminyltransferase C-like isoform X2 [Synchiropus splendidus]